MPNLTRNNIALRLPAWERFLTLKRSRGNWRALYSVLQKALELPLLRRWMDLYVGEIHQLSLRDAKRNLRALRSIVVREAGADDLDALAQFYDNRLLIESRFARDDLCVVALCGEELVAAAWLTVGPGEFLEDAIQTHCVSKIPLGVAWIYDGKGTKLGAWGSLMARLPDLLEKRGLNDLLGMVDYNSWQSIDAHRSLGFRNAATFACLGAFGFRRCFHRTEGRRWRRLPLTIADVQFCQAARKSG